GASADVATTQGISIFSIHIDQSRKVLLPNQTRSVSDQRAFTWVARPVNRKQTSTAKRTAFFKGKRRARRRIERWRHVETRGGRGADWKAIILGSWVCMMLLVLGFHGRRKTRPCDGASMGNCLLWGREPRLRRR